MDPLEDSNGDKKSLFQLDHATKIFLLTLVDAMLLFTVFVLAFFWYQGEKQLDAINVQVGKLKERFEMFEKARGVEAWETYQNEAYGFQIQYPSAWFLVEEMSQENLALIIASVPKENYYVGHTLPSEAMEVRVTKRSCTPRDNFFELGPYAESLEYLRKEVCNGDYQILLTLDKYDSQADDHKLLLESIGATFEPIL